MALLKRARPSKTILPSALCFVPSGLTSRDPRFQGSSLVPPAHGKHKALSISFAILLIAASCLGQQQSSPAPAKEENQQLSGKADSASDRKPFIGSVYPEDLSPLIPDSEATRWLHARRVRSYGWADAGYTYNSAGSGLESVAPSPNQFGNEFPVNGAWLVVERTTVKTGWSWGFRADFYGGSDAALLRPVPNFGPQGTHFGTDFRQAYVSLHTPGLNSRGIDFTVGRQNVPIGYETLMGPYRPMYSETYFWIHYEVGSTSALATLHPTGKLDVIGGVVMGYNTVFQLRGRAPSYLMRALYRPHSDPRTQLIATVFSGPEPAFVTPGHLGTWQTVAELQVRHTWTDRIAQVVQAHYAADVRDPTTKLNSATQGAVLFTAFKLNPKLYVNTRGEWFADPHGVRTGKSGTFSEATLGLNFLPVPFLNFRPEIRGDFAGQKSYSASLGGPASRNQLTIAFDLIVKFDAFK